MSEETIRRWTCERCNTVVEKAFRKVFFLNIAPKRPSGWGHRKGVHLCNQCVNQHDQGYLREYIVLKTLTKETCNHQEKHGSEYRKWCSQQDAEGQGPVFVLCGQDQEHKDQ